VYFNHHPYVMLIIFFSFNDARIVIAEQHIIKSAKTSLNVTWKQ
jgi:hypothetical protein